jgi:beta-ribofuranosylaminobenzene 5'-phosphate synthase
VKGAYGAREEEIFRKKCPILADDVEKVSRVIVVKILPAIVEKNITEFGEGINMLQNLGFKGIEVGLQRKTIGSLLDFMQENSAGAGMSSFGPVCYGICESKTEADSLAEDIKTDFCFNVISTKANNSGAKWL